MEVKFSELPEWAREKAHQVLGDRKRPRAYIEYTPEVNIGGVWHDACRRVVFARSGDGREIGYSSCYYDGILNASPSELAMYKGGKCAIPPDGMMVEILTYPEMITCYVHPSRAQKSLEETPDLTKEEKIALYILTSIKSGYRMSEFARFGIGHKAAERLFQALAAKGLAKVDGRGASATIKGRNLARQIDLRQY